MDSAIPANAVSTGCDTEPHHEGRFAGLRKRGEQSESEDDGGRSGLRLAQHQPASDTNQRLSEWLKLQRGAVSVGS